MFRSWELDQLICKKPAPKEPKGDKSIAILAAVKDGYTRPLDIGRVAGVRKGSIYGMLEMLQAKNLVRGIGKPVRWHPK